MGRRDGGVGVAHLRVRDLTALDDGLRLHAEERRVPEHEVGELAGLHGADLAAHALGHGRVDGVFGDIATDPVVVGTAVPGQGSAPLLHHMGGLPGPQDHLADPPHGLRVRGDDRDGAEVVEDVLGRDGGGPDPGLGERQVLGDGGVEVVADHQHVEVFLDGVDGVRPGGVGRAGQDVRLGDHADDVGRVPAARPLGVVRVDRPAGDGGEGVGDEPGLVECVRVDGELRTGPLADGEAGVDHGGRGAPVLVDLESQRPAAQLGVHRVLRHRVALAEQPDVDGEGLQRLEHPGQMPGAGGDGGGLGAFGGAGAATDEGGDAAGERLVDEGGRDEVDVGVDRSGREQLPVARDDLGLGADHQVGVDAVHGVRVPGLADAGDPAVPDADVGLDDAPVVDDDGAGDDGVGRALGPGGAGLAHGLADHLAAAEHRLVARVSGAARAVLLDLDEQIRVGEPDPVAGRGPEQVGVHRALEVRHRGHLRFRRAGRGRRGGRRGGRVRHRRGCRVRSAPPYRRRCSAAVRGRRRGRSAALGWPRRSGSGSRPGRGGRRR
ncbi:hypothetical protein P376_0101 [Streptomyces sp. HCCB10043]|nr:hypothetical protein P376_0101 [Streptomyces sp. HCCB10043]